MFPILQLEALTRRLPGCAVFSGRTAAWLHGLNVPPVDPIEVTLPRLATTSRRAGVTVVRSNLEPDELTEIAGLPVTARIRTIADLGRRSTPLEAVVVIDMALHRRLITVEELTSWIGRHRGYHGLRRLREACGLAEPAESPMETRLRQLLVTSGLPRPRVQASIYDECGGFIARPDLYFPEQRLAIEYDGATHRGSLAADNRRQNRMLEAGYRLLRFTAGDIYLRPAAVVSQTRRALSAAATPA